MNKRRATFLSLFAVAVVLLALNPIFSREPRAVAQNEGGVVERLLALRQALDEEVATLAAGGP